MVEPLEPGQATIVRTETFRIPYPPVIDRNRRREAQTIIFEELGGKTFRGRLAITREIRKTILEYYLTRALLDSTPTAAEMRKWSSAVAKHAGALADLLDQPLSSEWSIAHSMGISRDSVPALIQGLRALSRKRAGKISTWRGKGRAPDTPFQELLERLQRLYSAATGNAPGVSRSHDHYTDSQSAPGGPFLRLVSAVVILLDEQRTPEAIAKAIQRSAGQK